VMIHPSLPRRSHSGGKCGVCPKRPAGSPWPRNTRHIAFSLLRPAVILEIEISHAQSLSAVAPSTALARSITSISRDPD
jgi:hypothetical protein